MIVGMFQPLRTTFTLVCVPIPRDTRSCLLLVHHAFSLPTRVVSSNQNSQNISCSQSTILMGILYSILHMLFPIFLHLPSRPKIKYPSSLFHSLSLSLLSLSSPLLPLF